jgi:hypothetical protein
MRKQLLMLLAAALPLALCAQVKTDTLAYTVNSISLDNKHG